LLKELQIYFNITILQVAYVILLTETLNN